MTTLTMVTLINVAIICGCVLMGAATLTIVIAMIKKVIVSIIKDSTTAHIERDTRLAIHEQDMGERRSMYKGA